MKCPLLRMTVFANSNPDFVFNHDADDCREDCAWWVSHNFIEGQSGEKGACALQFLGRAAQRGVSV